jgi:hypothetical protein
MKVAVHVAVQEKNGKVAQSAAIRANSVLMCAARTQNLLFSRGFLALGRTSVGNSL